MKLSLLDIVTTLVVHADFTDNEIAETVEFLMQDNIMHSPKVFRKIVNKLKESLDYEDAPV